MSMTLSQQRRVVAVSSLVVFSLGIISRLEKGQAFDTDAARFYVGTGMAFTIISVFTDLGMEIGAGFAILIMLGALLTEGESVFGFLTNRSTGRKTKGAAKSNPAASGAASGTGASPPKPANSSNNQNQHTAVTHNPHPAAGPRPFK